MQDSSQRSMDHLRSGTGSSSSTSWRTAFGSGEVVDSAHDGSSGGTSSRGRGTRETRSDSFEVIAAEPEPPPTPSDFEIPQRFYSWDGGPIPPRFGRRFIAAIRVSGAGEAQPAIQPGGPIPPRHGRSAFVPAGEPRAGAARGSSCPATGTPLRLVYVSPDGTVWSQAQRWLHSATIRLMTERDQASRW